MEGRRGAVDFLHIDSAITGAREKKKNQATVTPDHYPLSTAFTNHIKRRLVKMMSHRKRKSKNKLDGIYYSSLELALLG